jgi:hypothetical protein
MARRGNNPGNPHLQVGSRVIQSLSRSGFEGLVALCLAIVLVLAAPSAGAATKKPTPNPTAKVTAKATVKPTAKVTIKASTKPTTSASAKPTVTKKPVVKKKKKSRAKVRVSPSPKPAWPPRGFSVEGEVYAKVPTAQELVGLISANSYLSKQIKQCTTYICGAVQVSSETGCLWWEAIATVTDTQGNRLGELNASFNSSGEREFKVLLLVSPETVEKGGAAKITSVICHHEDRDKDLPGTSYKKS